MDDGIAWCDAICGHIVLKPVTGEGEGGWCVNGTGSVNDLCCSVGGCRIDRVSSCSNQGEEVGRPTTCGAMFVFFLFSSSSFQLNSFVLRFVSKLGVRRRNR